MSYDFLGKGLRYPFRFQSVSGGTQVSTATSREHEHIRESILQILGPEFTLREAREVYAPFFQTTVDEIDNSNFRKTHGSLFTELGVQKNYHKSGRPPKLYCLKETQSNILWSKANDKQG